MMYGFETWALKNLDAMEMRMLRWMGGGVCSGAQKGTKELDKQQKWRTIQESAGKQVKSSLLPP